MAEADFSSMPDDFGYGDEASFEAGAQGAAQEAPAERYRHPWAIVFHAAFKVLALTVYLIFSLIFSGVVTNIFIMTFIITVLLLAADFWTVKNVTGRLLVGMRWWNQIEENGDTKWKFESRADQSVIQRSEVVWFWAWQIGVTVAWFAFAFKNIFTPDWLVVDAVGLTLAVANMIGYLKCAQAARRLRSMAGQYAVNHMVNQMGSQIRGDQSAQ